MNNDLEKQLQQLKQAQQKLSTQYYLAVKSLQDLTYFTLGLTLITFICISAVVIAMLNN